MGDVVQALRPTTKQTTTAADPLLLKHREMVLRYIEGALRGIEIAVPDDICGSGPETMWDDAVLCLEQARAAVGKYFAALGAGEA